MLPRSCVSAEKVTSTVSYWNRGTRNSSGAVDSVLNNRLIAARNGGSIQLGRAWGQQGEGEEASGSSGDSGSQLATAAETEKVISRAF